MKDKEGKLDPVEELNDELLAGASGGTDFTKPDLQDDTIQDETMLIIPIV